MHSEGVSLSVYLDIGGIAHSAAMVLVQPNRLHRGQEGGIEGGRKGRRRWGSTWRGLFVIVNQLRVVHIIWPLMAAPPLL